MESAVKIARRLPLHICRNTNLSGLARRLYRYALYSFTIGDKLQNLSAADAAAVCLSREATRLENSQRNTRFDGLAMKNYVKIGPATILSVVAYLTSCASTLYGADNIILALELGYGERRSLLSDTCDFSGLRLDNEVARVLARLPENHVPGPLELQPYGPGLEVAGFSLKGLNKLRLYGPLFPYCFNGSRLLQLDFVNDGDIVLSLPWKACSGHEGRFSVRAMFSRFTAQFRIVESSDEGVKLEPMGRIVPVATEGLRVIVDGAGTEVRSAFQVLSALFPSLVNEVWYSQFALEFHRALRKAIE